MFFAHGAMTGSADFHMDARGEFGRKAEPGTENLQNKRVARANDFHPAAHTNPERLETPGIFIVCGDASHHRAGPQRQFIQPHGGETAVQW